MSAESPLHLAGISIDCADPAQLAAFYVEVLHGAMEWSSEASAAVRVSPDIVLVCQRVADYRPPAWPSSSILHLDLAGDEGADPAALEQRALRAGARVAAAQFDSRWRVYLDPAGHPFCITTIVPS